MRDRSILLTYTEQNRLIMCAANRLHESMLHPKSLGGTLLQSQHQLICVAVIRRDNNIAEHLQLSCFFSTLAAASPEGKTYNVSCQKTYSLIILQRSRWRWPFASRRRNILSPKTNASDFLEENAFFLSERVNPLIRIRFCAANPSAGGLQLLTKQSFVCCY